MLAGGSRRSCHRLVATTTRLMKQTRPRLNLITPAGPALEAATRPFSASPSPPPPLDLTSTSTAAAGGAGEAATQSPTTDIASWHNFIYDSYPVQGMQDLLETIQATTGLPWWASIACSTLAFRMALLPVVRYQAHALAKLAKSGPLLMAMNQALSKKLEKIRPGDVKGTTAACREYAKGVTAALKIHEVKPLAAIASPLIQLPVFITFALANRRMIDTQVPGLETGGLDWFEDLTEPDPLLILPAVCLASTYMNLELGFAKLRESQTVLRFFKDNLQLLMLLGAPVSSTLPAGVFIYWFTSSMYGHVQHFALKNVAVREALGFPPLPVPLPSPAVGGGGGAGTEGGAVVAAAAGAEAVVEGGESGEGAAAAGAAAVRPGAGGGVGNNGVVDPRLLTQAIQALEKYEGRRMKKLGGGGEGKDEAPAAAAAATTPPLTFSTYKKK